MASKELVQNVETFIQADLDHEQNEDGFTLKEIYTEFCNNQNGVSFEDFKSAFYSCDKSDLVWDKRRRRWLTENSFSSMEEAPQSSLPIDQYFSNLMKTGISDYLVSLVDEELTEILRPIVKEFVKVEFETKVLPAVVKNLKQHVTDAIDEIRMSVDEQLISNKNLGIDTDKLRELVRSLVNEYVSEVFNMQ